MATIKVTQTKSSIGRLPKHKACLKGLGLRKINHTVELELSELCLSCRVHDLTDQTERNVPVDLKK